jgi:hypothetical protein
MDKWGSEKHSKKPAISTALIGKIPYAPSKPKLAEISGA